MELNRDISILGRKVAIAPMAKECLKGISIGEKMTYRFYSGTYQGEALLFVEPKKNNPTPRECDITGQRLSRITGLPVVFILKAGPAYERQRLMDKGIYFIMSDRYAHLPGIVALEKLSNRKVASTLTPVAQYLLLFHLQVKSIEGLTAKEITTLVPYSYASVSIGITCLADLKICTKIQQGQRNKLVHFERKGVELWHQAQPYLQSPVEQRIFCDGLENADNYPCCGINALAYYTMLNPDPEKMVMMTSSEYRTAISSGTIEHPNVFDGNIVVEVWKYPAVASQGFVDKLSLALSLQEDDDPRVQKEVERMINEMKWMV
jgi:hypothetical protein